MTTPLAKIQWTDTQLDRYIDSFMHFTKANMNLTSRLTFAQTQLDEAEAELEELFKSTGLFDVIEDWDLQDGVLSIKTDQLFDLTDEQRKLLLDAGIREVWFDEFGPACREVLSE